MVDEQHAERPPVVARRLRFNPPPTWPRPPDGWRPAAGWRPHPSWPAPPAAWPLWVEDVPAGTGGSAAPWYSNAGTSRQPWYVKVAVGVIVAVAVLFSVDLLVVVTSGF
jgi:hypothetical protein